MADDKKKQGAQDRRTVVGEKYEVEWQREMVLLSGVEPPTY